MLIPQLQSDKNREINVYSAELIFRGLKTLQSGIHINSAVLALFNAE